MAGSQISTGITIINSLKGFQSISLTNNETSDATAIAAGSVVEVAGTFFQWSSDETPSGWSAIATAETAYIALTPSGAAGSQTVSAAYTATAPTWRNDNQGWYASAVSNIRYIGHVYKTSATEYDYKFTYSNGMIARGEKGIYGRGHTYGVYGSGKLYGVRGAGDTYGVRGVGGVYGVRGNGDMYGVHGNGGTYGVYGGSSIYGVYGTGITHGVHGAGGTYGVYGGNSANGVGGFGTTTGVYGDGGTWDFYAGGAGTNYGPFTGAHEVMLIKDAPKDILPGMILSATGEVKTRKGSISSTAPTVRLADSEADKSVFGVYVLPLIIKDDSWLAPWKDQRWAAANALGEGRVLVTDVNGELQLGDWITSSKVPGYGMKQDDDLLHSYTVAKVTEAVDWGKVPGKKKYKKYLIACTYVCG